MSAGHLDETRLLALGLGEPPSAAEAQHLSACAACATGVREDAQLWALVKEVPQPVPPPRLAVGAVARFRRARAVGHRPREVAVGTLIALGLLAVLAFWIWRLTPGAATWVALALPRWPSVFSTGRSWVRVLAAAAPVLAVSAGLLLAAVAVVLRRLTAVTAK
jgi:hypothetical protein